MHNIYILLTRSPSMISRVIHYTTGDDFTHSSIAYDDDLYTLCSFARKYPRLMLPAGLVREKLEYGYYRIHANMPCALLCLSVSDVVYARIRSRVDRMISQKDDYRYDACGLIRCKFGKESNRPNRYFCSKFVSEVLEDSGAARLPKPTSLMRPQDFMDMPQLTVLYRGSIAGLILKVQLEEISKCIAAVKAPKAIL